MNDILFTSVFLCSITLQHISIKLNYLLSLVMFIYRLG